MSTQDPYHRPSGDGWQPAPENSGQPTPDPYAQPAYGAPAYGQPAYGQPAYGQPAYGQPAYAGHPAFGAVAPAYGTSTRFGAPAYGAPAYGHTDLPYPGHLGAYASWLQRVGAYLLDSLAILPYLGGLLVMSVLTEPGFDQYGTPADQPTSTGVATFAVGALTSFTLWGWNRWVRAGRTGRSWGKQALGLTLKGDVTGAPLGIWMAFVRDLAHYVDGFFYLGYLWPLWDGKRQTFSDKLTKSVVVR